MKTLARWASWYSSPGPKLVRHSLRQVFAVLFGAALLVALCAVHAAYAAHDVATAAPPPDVLAFIVQLYGPACGVLAALVILFERVARVIPNSTTNKILKSLLVVATIFGVKVPDNQ